MRADAIFRSLTVLLLVALVVQVGRRALRETGAGTTGTVRIGEPFPAALLGVATPEEVSVPDGCWVAFVIHPKCLSCGRLADRLGSRTGPGQAINLLWISVGGPRQTTDFVAAHDLPGEWVFVLEGGQEGRDLSLLQGIGLGAIPTRLLLSEGGIVSEILLTHQLPEPPGYERLCWPAE